MKKRIYIVSLLFIILLSVSTAVSAVRPTKHDLIYLVDAGKSIEGDILGYSVHGHIKVREITNVQIEDFLCKVGYQSTIDANNSIEEKQTSHLMIDWFLDDNYHKLSITEKTEGVHYISFSVDLARYEDIYKKYDLVKSALYVIDEDVHITTSIYKELSANLELLDIVEQISNSFRMLSATLINDYADGKSFAFLGYSPYLVNTVDFEGKLYNLHIAVNYDEYADSYHLIIANPIIESSY